MVQLAHFIQKFMKLILIGFFRDVISFNFDYYININIIRSIKIL